MVVYRHGYFMAECPRHGEQTHLTYLGGACTLCAADGLARHDAVELRKQRSKDGVVHEIRKEKDGVYHVLPMYDYNGQYNQGNTVFGDLVVQYHLQAKEPYHLRTKGGEVKCTVKLPEGTELVFDCTTRKLQLPLRTHGEIQHRGWDIPTRYAVDADGACWANDAHGGPLEPVEKEDLLTTAADDDGVTIQGI